MGSREGRCFIAAALGLTAGALLHLAALLSGPDWIAFVGAPAAVVESAENGSWLAPVGALAITGLLVGLALYAFSAAGLIRRLPLLRPVLALFAVIFTLRGLIIVPAILSGRVNWRAPSDLFILGSSIFILAIGMTLLCGLFRSRTAARSW